jgi:hypothetical protein
VPEITTAARIIERDRELSLFEDLVRPDGAGGCGLVVIEGTAGIGKSRLIAELRDRAVENGFLVMGANGSDLEREFPFGVVRQLFDPLLAAPDTPKGCSRAQPHPPGRCSPPWAKAPRAPRTSRSRRFTACTG